MIVELVGMPGAGKTALAESLRSRGARLVPLPSRSVLLLQTLFFWLSRPWLAVRLFAHMLEHAPKGMCYELFLNGYAGYAARYRMARKWSMGNTLTVLDQGFFQLIVSLHGLPESVLQRLPRPDALVVVSAHADVRRKRMTERGWAPRSDLGEKQRQTWEAKAEAALQAALPALHAHMRVLEYDGTQDASQGALSVERFVRTPCISPSRTSVRALAKLLVLIFAFITSCVSRLRDRSPEAVVLMYHAVDNSGWKLAVRPEEFERQMAYLARKDWAVPLADVVSYARGNKLPAHAVAVTFDDGYRDMLTTTLPILERYRIPATVFVPSDISVRTSPDDRPRLTEEELCVLAQSPFITVGSHAQTHHRFTELAPEEMKKESEGSAEKLANILGKRPIFFAYPFGAYSADAERAVKDAGYEAAFGITEGTIRQDDDLFRLKRVQIDGTMSLLLFRLRLTTAVNWNRRIVDLSRRTLDRCGFRTHN